MLGNTYAPPTSLPAFVAPLAAPAPLGGDVAGSGSGAGPGAGAGQGAVHDLLDGAAGEEWIGGEEGVGLYHGNAKMPRYQSVTVHLTTHRLLVLSGADAAGFGSTSGTASGPSSPFPGYARPSATSAPPHLQLDLSFVRQTEFYTGFMRSSAKISLFLGPPEWPEDADVGAVPPGSPAPGNGTGEGWTCAVCGFANQASESVIGRTGGKCALCGVARGTISAVRTAASVPASGRSTPAPSSTGGSSLSPSPMPAATTDFAPPRAVPSTFEIACPQCTFLNHPSLRACEICGATLRPTPPPAAAVTSAGRLDPGSRAPTPSPGTIPGANGATAAPSARDILRLSFRRGGEKELYRRLKSVLAARAWVGSSAAGRGGRRARIRERTDEGSGRVDGRTSTDGGGRSGANTPRTGAGIDGIMQNMSLESRAQGEDVADAFSDLEALMVRAGEMVKLVQSLNAKLTAQQAASDSAGGPSESDTTLIRSSLVQLGLPTPALTLDMVRGQQAFIDGLARELGGLLTGTRGREGYMTGPSGRDGQEGKGRGLIGLDEVWVVWNRARGVSLVSPKDFRAVLQALPAYTSPPINVLECPSGLSLLHTPHYSHGSFSARLQRTLTPPEADTELGLSAIDIALAEGIAVGLAAEMASEIEMNEGSLARDTQDPQSGGERWYRNLIAGFVWEDPNLGQVPA